MHVVRRFGAVLTLGILGVFVFRLNSHLFSSNLHYPVGNLMFTHKCRQVLFFVEFTCSYCIFGRCSNNP